MGRVGRWPGAAGYRCRDAASTFRHGGRDQPVGHLHHLPPAGGHDRPFAIGIALNQAFVVVEADYGWKVGSPALLADAGHNLDDVAGLALAWGGAPAGRLRPDARHTYGWQRASILAAFISALPPVAMGALALEAVQCLTAPTPVAARRFRWSRCCASTSCSSGST